VVEGCELRPDYIFEEFVELLLAAVGPDDEKRAEGPARPNREDYANSGSSSRGGDVGIHPQAPETRAEIARLGSMLEFFFSEQGQAAIKAIQSNDDRVMRAKMSNAVAEIEDYVAWFAIGSALYETHLSVARAIWDALSNTSRGHERNNRTIGGMFDAADQERTWNDIAKRSRRRREKLTTATYYLLSNAAGWVEGPPPIWMKPILDEMEPDGDDDTIDDGGGRGSKRRHRPLLILRPSWNGSTQLWQPTPQGQMMQPRSRRRRRKTSFS
jgi:hypothetical protein